MATKRKSYKPRFKVGDRIEFTLGFAAEHTEKVEEVIIRNGKPAQYKVRLAKDHLCFVSDSAARQPEKKSKKS